MDPVGAASPARKLILTGFMGAGKTRALGHLSDAGLRGVDVDDLLPAALGMSIEDFFATRSEGEFREIEATVVQETVDSGEWDVVALGGGSIVSPAVQAAIDPHVVVWLRVPLNELWRRVSKPDAAVRPLAKDEEGFRRRYAEREPLFRAAADAVVMVADDIGDAAASLRALAATAPDSGTRLLWASSSSGAYPAWVGSGILGGIAALDGGTSTTGDGRRWLVTDRNVGPLYAATIGDISGVIEIEDGEQAKNLATTEQVWAQLAEAGATRFDSVLALGGGVVGDLAGFVAATYQRGVPFVQVPTTLVAQVDSAYGGKTGIDIPAAKNYVGAYHLPAAVIADVDTLATLPERELAAGYVELLKTALIAGGEFWERTRVLGELGGDALREAVFDCAITKIEVVAADERDGGRREVLNLGHTVGHAIETVTGYGRYRHGEAVGLGMLAALRLSGQDELRTEVAELLAARGLPVSLDPSIDAAEVLAATARDKKRAAAGVRYVLLEAPGEVSGGHLVDDAEVLAAISELHG